VTRVLYHEVEQRCLEAVCVFDRRHHDKLASSQQTFPPDLYNGEIPRIRLFRGSRIRLLSFRIIEAHHVIAASSRPIRIVTMICQKSAITWSADSFGRSADRSCLQLQRYVRISYCTSRCATVRERCTPCRFRCSGLCATSLRSVSNVSENFLGQTADPNTFQATVRTCLREHHLQRVATYVARLIQIPIHVVIIRSELHIILVEAVRSHEERPRGHLHDDRIEES